MTVGTMHSHPEAVHILVGGPLHGKIRLAFGARMFYLTPEGLPEYLHITLLNVPGMAVRVDAYVFVDLCEEVERVGSLNPVIQAIVDASQVARAAPQEPL